MKTRQQLVNEMRLLNQKLDAISNNSRYMVYSANPFKFAIFNFIAGVFHSLGSLFGTAVIAAAFVYVFSQVDFIKPITNWTESILTQIRWDKVLPLPTPPEENP